MISAKDIPHFTGDLEQLERHASGLRAHAGALRQAGAATHSRFQGLEAFYEAPEAERLFASTAPVRDRADLFASKVETVAGALDDYAGAVRPIVARLDRLRTRAAAFVASLKTDGGEIDDEWTQDQEKVDEHAALWAEIARAQADFTAAETAANNKITAMVGGTQYVPQGDGVISGPLGARVYGYTAEALEHADKLPWGTPEARTYDTWDYKHHLKDAGVGFKDAFVSTAVGMVDLVSPGAKGDTARKGLGMAVLGLESYLVDPLNQKDGPWNERMAKGRPYAKAFAKGLVGWDDWQDHPGKATGTVIFNGLTLSSGPLGAVAKLAKGGAVAKTAGALAKVGEAIDPIGAAAKTVGVTTRAIPKIAEVTARARAGFGDMPHAGSTSSVWKFSPRSELNLINGKFVHIKDGTPDTTPAPVEPAAHERAPSVAAAGEHQLVGAGMRAPETGTHAGEDLPPQAGHDAAAGGKASPQPEHRPGGSEGLSLGHSRDVPGGTGAAHSDGSAPGSGDAGGPPGSGGSRLPDGPMEPRGNLADGSWEGPQGLALSPRANTATNQFMDRALATEPNITDAIQSAAARVEHGKLNGLDYRLKGEESLKRKVATALLEDARLTPEGALANIKDSLRYTVEIRTKDYSHGVQQAVNDLRTRGFENVTFKNTWEGSGYKGINSTWRDPATGQVFEVQFHTPESFAAKMDTHVLYERERLPGTSDGEVAAIRAEQDSLFSRVPVPHGTDSIRLDVDLRGSASPETADIGLGKQGNESVHANGPPSELSPEQRAVHEGRLRDLAQHHSDDFEQLKQDPDHKGKVKPSEMDEARVALDLREKGKVPDDIQRPPGANQGDLYSPGTGEFYDIKGVHSDWPPLNNVRDKSLPFKGAYDPANNERWVRKLEDQIVTRQRMVILDMRNANQAAIDDVKAIVEQHGWSDRVVWYP
ncbi:hypothetical protein [Streptomyces alfalfae]|uniref:Uncharacterized protein n=1 Tax=Streptomyces alfalfae TaxID=1642299 RepID=A0A7T4TXL1_9ACTN|nr:hypothetical protein [Streptomyces alfalfae]QQC89030.1 hypothetical protein I8755_11810 [Streptomyces alfalfae]